MLVKDKIYEIITTKIGDNFVLNDNTIWESIDIDILDFTEIIMEIEAEYKIFIDDSILDYLYAKPITCLINYVLTKIVNNSDNVQRKL